MLLKLVEKFYKWLYKRKILKALSKMRVTVKSDYVFEYCTKIVNDQLEESDKIDDYESILFQIAQQNHCSRAEAAAYFIVEYALVNQYGGHE